MRDSWTRAHLDTRRTRRVRLVSVSRLGLAPSYGVEPRSVDEAFERGVDFFFWGAIRRWGFGLALRRLIRRHPGRVVIAIQSFVDSAFWLARSVDVARVRLGVDAIDLLCLAYRNTALDPRVWEAALELRARGRVRALMVSSHDRTMLVSLAGRVALDAIMTRYNAAHRGAEEAVFPAAVAAGKGVLVYTATRWGSLLDPASIPAGERPPRASDCYRFVLGHDAVDACLIGPANEAELREALVALERGPMTEEERAWMIRVGDGVRAHRRAAPPLGVTGYVRQAPSMAASLLRRGVTEDLLSRFNR